MGSASDGAIAIAGKQESFTIVSLYGACLPMFGLEPEGALTWSVLVVDDEPMARTLLRLMLVRAGFEVIEAEDGFDALDRIKNSPPDIMILDVMMPGLDGFSVAEAVRADSTAGDLPIIMLSAKTDLESVNKGLRIGANRYLTKPISPDELARQVRDVLEGNDEPMMEQKS